MWVTTRHQGRTVQVNTALIEMLRPDQLTVHLSSGMLLTLSEDDFSDLQGKLFPTRKFVAKDDAELAEYLNTLHRLTGGKNAAILTPERKKKLDNLLKSMSREQLIAAATNIGKDKWLQGENDKHKRWGDVDFLLRPDKAAKYAEIDTTEKRKKMF